MQEVGDRPCQPERQAVTRDGDARDLTSLPGEIVARAGDVAQEDAPGEGPSGHVGLRARSIVALTSAAVTGAFDGGRPHVVADVKRVGQSVGGHRGEAARELRHDLEPGLSRPILIGDELRAGRELALEAHRRVGDRRIEREVAVVGG